MTIKPVRRPIILLLCAPACLLMVVPFWTLLAQTDWHNFHLAYGDLDAVEVSIALGMISLMLIFALGIPPAFWLARTQSGMKPFMEALVMAGVITPPLAMGILLISAYGPYGDVGELLEHIGLVLNNNMPAFVIAQLYGGTGYFILAARSAFEGVPVADEEAARTLGASQPQTFWYITLPLASRGIAAGLVLAWVRIVGEFGIVVVFAYFPHGIPVALFTDLQNDGVDAVYTLLWLMLAVTLPLPLLTLAMLGRRGTAPRHIWLG